MQNRYPKLRHIDFLLVDLFSLLLSFTVVFRLKFGGQWFVSGAEWTNTVWARLVLLFCAADIVLTLVLDPYSGIFRRKYYMEFVRALRLTLFNAISVALVLYIFKIGIDYSRTVFVMTYVTYFFFSLLLKYIWKMLIVSGKIKAYSNNKHTLFIVSQTNLIKRVIRKVSAGDYVPFEIKGIYFTDLQKRGTYRGIPVCGTDYAAQIVRNHISDVLIALPPHKIRQEDYKELIDNAVNVHISMEDIIGLQTEDQFVSDLGVCKAVSMTAFRFRPGQMFYLFFKRLLDILFGLLGLLLLIPISAAVKIAYLSSGDKASIFYRQNRVGKNGKLIRIYKFRTMVPNADRMLRKLLRNPKYRAEWEATQKLVDDPRITKVGRFLRKSSIDELPQVLNLLKSDMSLVGPRPLVEGELEEHGGLHLYQRVKPGITGWWACNGRSNLAYRERLELEYYYVKHFSIYLDVLCVFRTAFAVLRRKGAK